MEFGIKAPSLKDAVVHFHSSEQMAEVADASAKLVMGPSVYLGTCDWGPYADLYSRVYNNNLRRVVREDGIFIVIQTNAYSEGKFICRYRLLLDLLDPFWELVDEKVWKRKNADHFQVPFSHVLIFRPKGGAGGNISAANIGQVGSFKRRMITDKRFFQGVWEFKQTKGSDKASYPDDLCTMLVESCTQRGDLIVDPFAGSAQLLATAARLGRKAVGYEIDPKMRPLIEKKGVQIVG